MEKVTVDIPAHWLEELDIGQDELRQALLLGLAELRRQQAVQSVSEQVAQVLSSTGRVHRLEVKPTEAYTLETERQEPPVLAGRPASEVLIAQRQGEE